MPDEAPNAASAPEQTASTAQQAAAPTSPDGAAADFSSGRTAAGPAGLADFASGFKTRLASEAGDVDGAGAEGDKPVAAQGEQGEADAAGDIVARFGLAEYGLTPEQSAAITPKLAALEQATERYHGWFTQAQQQYGQMQDVAGRMYAILADPRIDQALRMIQEQGGQAGGSGGQQQGEQPPAFESETEQRLWNEVQTLRQQQAQMRDALQQTQGGFEAFRGEAEQSERRVKATQYAQDIAATWERLEADFPGLERDQVREKARALIRAQREAGDPVDVAAAMRDAAMIVHYPNAKKAGASTALAAAKKAARQAALPREASGGDADLKPRDGEGLGEFAQRAAPAMAV